MNNTLKRKHYNEQLISKLFKIYLFLTTFAVCAFFFATTAFAAIDPIEGINNLEEYIATFFEAIGVIAMLVGGFMIGVSFFSHDNSQRITGIAAFGGGMFLAGITFVIDKVTGA